MAVTFDLAPLYGSFPATVTYTLTGLPPGATYSFNPASLPAASAGAPITVTINVPVTAASTHMNAGKYGVVFAGLLLLPFAGTKRIRKRFGRMSMVLLLLLAGGAMSALTGCGGGNGTLSESPNSYQVTLTITSGMISHSVPFTLDVE